MNDCVFCNIINRTIDSQIVHETDNVIVIKDILPKAPVHLLLIPKEHIVSINHLEPKHRDMIWETVSLAKVMAEKFEVSESGYKLTVNVGRDGGQVIPHLHFHLLGGKKFSE